MNFLKKLFGSKQSTNKAPKSEFSENELNEDYELKTKALENLLGPMHNIVGHAIIPFTIGGAVDMYYFPNHIPGTGFATMELLDPDGNGPKSNRIGTYELVAFTQLTFNDGTDKENAFNLIERRICGIFTAIGNYSFQAILNPGDTVEVPNETDENICLIFDHYNPEEKEFRIGERRHHLLLCLEVFRSEMEFARKNGSEKLLELMKANGIYPYSDLNRKPLV